MVLHNNMEDIILNVIDEMLKNTQDTFWKNELHKHDLACYVLNRVKPRYITSGRGLLHWEQNFERNIQENVDIFCLVAEGMNTIFSRREDEKYPLDEEDDELGKEIDHTQEYYFNFPYFIGKVISMRTWEEVSGITVCLKHKVNNDYQLTLMMSKRWQNPYIISEKTNGFYTFFPQPFLDPSEKGSTKTFEFSLLFEHPNLERIEKPFMLDISSEQKKFSTLRRGYVHKIDDVYVDEK